MPAPHPRPWDLVVIGGGTAGLVGARTAASLGARVLLVERALTGGECLWSGCVPSKALLAAAAAAADARAAGRYGVRTGQVTVDGPAVLAAVRAARDAIAPVDSPQALEAAGVRVRRGDAVFTGERSLEVRGDGSREQVLFRHALVATGSRPAVPGVPGLAEAGALTNETVWDLPDLPASLVVLGGGSIGCELGQALARLGTRVTLLEEGDRLLVREDPEAARLVQQALESDGVQVLLGVRVVQVGSGRVRLQDGRELCAERLLVATGRQPRTDGLGLDAAGVRVGPAGEVVVDDHLRTDNPRIFAAGDVTGLPRFTHVAGVHATTAVTNAVLGLRARAEHRVVPRVTFTSPEVGTVGTQTGRVRVLRHHDVDRAVVEQQADGFTRLVLGRRGRVLGATVVGPRAGEALAELTVAVQQGLRTRDLAGTMHAYPTYADGTWNAAVADVRSLLDAPLARLATRALVRLTRLRR